MSVPSKNRMVLCSVFAWFMTTQLWGQSPAPVLQTIFPAGGRAGSSVDVTITGTNLGDAAILEANIPGMDCEPHETEAGCFCLSIPDSTPVGAYDMRVTSKSGISAPRTFFVGNRSEILETESNDVLSKAETVPLSTVVNGTIEKGGDQDCFTFNAQEGQRVILECTAKRGDSRLRAVLEVFNEQHERIASNRGYFGIDPLIQFHVPSDGSYIVKIYDLVFSGSLEHGYRLAIDTGPRVVFTVPSVVEIGKPTIVSLYGWNLLSATNAPQPNNFTATETFDRLDVEISGSRAQTTWPLTNRLNSIQYSFEGLAYHLPGAHKPVLLGVTDIPVITDYNDNHEPEHAHHISIPCEVSSQLTQSGQVDWFSLDAKRGEVFFLEAFGQRIQSPVDLDLRVFNKSGDVQLAEFGDELTNLGKVTFPTSHLDPSGRWVAPEDGRYLILVRNLIGGLKNDPRRVYRLSVRREEPVFDVVAMSENGDASINVSQGGRAVVDVLAVRRRGSNESIRIYAQDLPAGLECPEVWLGPDENRAKIIVSANHNAELFDGTLNLFAEDSLVKARPVRGTSIVRKNVPTGWSRLTERLAVATVGEAPLRASADGQQPRDHPLYGRLKVRHAPGGVLDVLVNVERRDGRHRADVKLSGVGLPALIDNQTAIIPASEDQGYVSFLLPTTLPIGKYSLVIKVETTTLVAGKDEPIPTVVYTNPVNFTVNSAAFAIHVAANAPQTIRRGEVVQVNYAAQRINGFIGKIHSELAAPGKVTELIGLRGRGVTFVGQTETGVIQIVANDDAPLGQQPFLRIYGVGVVEDEAVFHGSCWLNLEIVE